MMTSHAWPAWTTAQRDAAVVAAIVASAPGARCSGQSSGVREVDVGRFPSIRVDVVALAIVSGAVAACVVLVVVDGHDRRTLAAIRGTRSG